MASRDIPEYHSYLLRLWRVSNPDGVGWRASLENAKTGERLGFANQDMLFEYLNQQTKSSDKVDVELINDDVISCGV